jgi:hypothetical protein
MALLCVPQAKLLCQAAMDRIPALEYMLSGMRGLLLPHLDVLGAKRHHFWRPQC